MKTINTPMQGVRGLRLYHMTHQASRLIRTYFVPRLSGREHQALVNQLSRASQALPRLIEQNDVEEAIAEVYELVVGLCCCHYWYTTQVDTALCRTLIETYSQVGRQLLGLAEAQPVVDIPARTS